MAKLVMKSTSLNAAESLAFKLEPVQLPILPPQRRDQRPMIRRRAGHLFDQPRGAIAAALAMHFLTQPIQQVAKIAARERIIQVAHIGAGGDIKLGGEDVAERVSRKVAELSLRGEEVFYEGDVVDLAYRDYPVADLIDLEREGKDVEPMRALFRQNRMISSITAELDQKSCWEILTDAQFTRKYFSADERQVFRRHVLWMRILSDRRTHLPNGETGDLLEYVRKEHESLVLKPNRDFVGHGVVLGLGLPQSEWESAMERALADKEHWVVQQLASIPVSEFPVLGSDGKAHVEPFYVVMGFAATKYGIAVLGRASQKQVVNVAQRGGMCAIMMGRPPTQLIGPGLAS